MMIGLLLLVIHQSLSLGIALPSECADALRAVTRHGAKITHVRTLDVREFDDASLIRITVPTGLAYTVQGPDKHVGIIVCAPVRPEPEPEE